ncbi:MAG TPA: C-terminal binding protein [Azospirillum sp.]
MSAPEQRLPVVVLDEGYGDYDIENAVLAPLGAVVVPRPCGGDAARVRAAVPGAVAVLVRESPIDARALDAMPGCRVIVRYGVGVDNIDLKGAAERGIHVANVPDYGVDEVSDHALALLLAVARRVVSRDRAVRAGAWNVARAEPMYRLRGRVLGLLGYGRIAAAFHRKAAALGFAGTLVHDPFLKDPPDGAALVDVDTLCREADVLSLHAPLNAGTRHILNRARITLLKPTAIVVNTGRGPLLDAAALAEALRDGRLFGAGIDVFETEPPPPDDPLLHAPRVVVTDHTAWYSEQAVADLQRKAAEEVARVLRGEKPVHWVNRWP